jgi:predicted O-linked N-acetylglucosamine transferase (SPINDLY family)
LRRRWERTLPDAARRIRWLSAQPHDDYLALLECADVVLDPLHFGGGNTSYEALAMGTPVVTLPGTFLRSRITAALYRKLGQNACVVESPESYVRTTLRLACDREFRSAVRKVLSDSAGSLFDDPREIPGLEEFFLSTGSRSVRRPGTFDP